MDACWSDPRHVLAVVERLLAVPRVDLYEAFAAELERLIPHHATAIQTGDCARSPLAVAGDPAITEAVTSTELLRLSERAEERAEARAGGPAEGSAEASSALLIDAVLAGAERRLVLLASARSLLVIVPEEPEPPAAALDVAARLWRVLSTDQSRRATAQTPDLLAGNLAAAAARARTITDLGQSWSTTLTGLLAVLRSARLTDPVARRTATDLAAEALIELKAVADRDQELSAEPASASFAALENQLAPLVRHTDADITLAGPAEDGLIPQDIAHTARAATRGLVLAAIDRPGTTRIRASWRLTGQALHITVRDNSTDKSGPAHGSGPAHDGSGPTHDGSGPTHDGSGPTHDGSGPTHDGSGPTHDVTRRLAALGGSWEVDAVPGWGTTVTASLPLGIEAPADVRPLDRLNPRELEVLAGIAQGLRNRAIAERLQLSEHTVKFHVRNILDKLQVSSRGEAAALSFRR
ncbi:response regulator transcription factor [Winogradskya consettensis]|uniref:Helix-turn-helix transcriptional regulator n=1 Tax=Winogradskya consettensis TaxID=113560 RepID=A0A919VSU6_9ACTN|nr:helix-turn-helix transcriptional regulator [Actinoplanes consettensis]GIM77574.1 helix-turn-helix transcriptional regulator [Actinoplanes consettensis]